MKHISAVRSADELLRRLTDVCSWVCAIDDGQCNIGTGILIGADLVLTNHHLLETLYLEPGRIGGASVRFDFIEDIGHEGRRVRLAADWHLELPCSSDIDYAVIRLAEKVGDQPVADKDDRPGPQRSWMALLKFADELKPGAEISVLQHPVNKARRAAQPQIVSSGQILQLLNRGTWLRHNATTVGGSSGGAVFDAHFRLIAINQGGNAEQAFNQAISMSVIVADMEQKGFVPLVPPERRRPSAPIAPQPALGARWTVDDVPIVWSMKEPRELERTLIENIDAQMALYSAENAGLPPGIVNPNSSPQLLWREILKKASVAGVLRPLLEELAAAPQHAGIAAKLKTYL